MRAQSGLVQRRVAMVPNPAVKRTHTGGVDLLVSIALRAPVCAAYLRR